MTSSASDTAPAATTDLQPDPEPPQRAEAPGLVPMPLGEGRRRLAGPLLISLLVHGLLLGLSFGGDEDGLPGFNWPWRARRAEVPELRAVLMPQPAYPSAPVEAPPMAGPSAPVEPVEPALTVLGVTLAPAREEPAPASEEAAAATVGASKPVLARAAPADGAPEVFHVPAPLPATTAPVTMIEPTVAPALIGVEPPQRAAWYVPAPPAEPVAMPVPMPIPPPEPAASSADRATPALPDVKEVAAEQPRVQQAVVNRAEVEARAEAQRQAEQLEATRREAERQQAAKAEAARQEAARLEAARLEAERVATARLDAARQEAARQEAVRQEAARQEAARQEAARQEAARREAAQQEAVRQEAARQEAARTEAARQEATRQEAARQEATRQEAVRQEAARQAAALQEAARQQAARAEAARTEALQRQAEDERREAIKRAIGRQLDEEAARRDAAARAAPPPSQLPYSINTPRRGRLFGRADANAELVAYAEAWARKIHLNRTSETIREVLQRPHRQPLVTVALRSDGSVESITFVVSSGVPEVDDAIRRVVESLVPFQPFPPALARDYDVIEIRRSWVYDTAIRLQ